MSRRRLPCPKRMSFQAHATIADPHKAQVAKTEVPSLGQAAGTKRVKRCIAMNRAGRWRPHQRGHRLFSTPQLAFAAALVLATLGIAACTSDQTEQPGPFSVAVAFDDPPAYPGYPWTRNGEAVPSAELGASACPNYCDL